MSDSKDNVKVVLRARPLNQKELNEGGSVSCISADTQQNTVTIETTQPRTFTYDYVADESVTQEQVFQYVGKPIAVSCLSGYNGTIFAYGQTGTGKTFTIMGPGAEDEFEKSVSCEQRGILPRCFEFIFNSIAREKRRNDQVEYLVKCSFLEIYQEQVLDLLDHTCSQNLQLRENMERGVYVDGIVEETVSTLKEMYQILTTGTRNRHVGSTAMNKESSRSHSVFTLTIQCKEIREGLVNFRNSKFHLIDLAGSERQKATSTTGERLKEAGMINKSLSALGNVINSLVDVTEGKSRHVHYRDSKLTFLLKDSLGGNSKTCVVANISPSRLNFGETLSTLQFAARAKQIKNKAIINEDTSGAINILRNEVKRLKDELERLKNTPCSTCAISPSKRTSLGWQCLQSLSPTQTTEDTTNLSPVQQLRRRRNAQSPSMGNWNFRSSLVSPNDGRKNSVANQIQQLETLLESNLSLRTNSDKNFKQQLESTEEYIKSLQGVISKHESKISQDKMVLKFREATIARLQAGQPDDDAEKADLRAEIAALREQIDSHPLAAKLFLENSKLKEQVEESKKENESYLSQLEQRLKENEAFTEQLSAYLKESAEERAALHKRFDTPKVAEYNQQLETLENDINKERQEQEHLQLGLLEKLDMAEKQIAEQQEEIEALQGSTSYIEMQDAVTEEMERQYAQLQGDYGLVAERFSVSEEELARAKEKIQELTQRAQTFEEKYICIFQEESTYQDDLTKLEQTLEHERERMSDIESERDRLKQDLDVLSEEQNFLIANQTEMQKEISERQSYIGDLDLQLTNNMETIKQLQSQIELHKGQDGQLDIAMAEVSTLQTTIQDMRASYDKKAKHAEELSTKIKVLTQTNAELSNSDEGSKQIITELQATIGQLKDQLHVTDEKLHSYIEEVEFYETEKSQLLGKIEEGNTRRKELKEQKRQVESSIATQKEEISAKETELRRTQSVVVEMQGNFAEERKLENNQKEVKLQLVTEKYESQLKEAQEETAKLQESLKAAKQCADQYQTLSVNLTQTQADQSCELARLKDENTRLCESSPATEQLKAEINTLREENQNLKEENQAKMEILQNTNKNIMNTRNEIDMWKKCIDEKNSSIQELRAELRKKDEETPAKLDEAESEVKYLKCVLQMREKELQELKEKGQVYYAQADEAIASQRTEIEGVQKKNNSLQVELAKTKEDLRISVQHREAMVEEIKRLRAEELRTYKENEDYKSILNHIKEEKSRLMKDMEILNKENNRLAGHNNLNQKIKLHAKMKEEHNNLKMQNAKLSDDLRKKSNQCDVLQTKLNEITKKTGQRQITHDDLEEIKLRKTVKSQNDEIQALNESNNKINDFVFSLPCVSMNPEETQDTEATIKAIAGLYELYEAQHRELRTKDKELQQKNVKLSILENEHQLWKQKQELQAASLGMGTASYKTPMYHHASTLSNPGRTGSKPSTPNNKSTL